MQDVWNRIESWISANAPNLSKALGPPVSKKALAEFEEVTKLKLPEDFAASLAIHDGDAPGMTLISGCKFMPLKRITAQWHMWRNLALRGEFDDMDAVAEGPVQPVWYSMDWIPFFAEGLDRHYCLDLDPAEGGNVGQVILLYHEANDREFEAPSFRDFLSGFADELEGGKFVYTAGALQPTGDE